MEFPVTFDKCPVCGERDTVTRQACKNEPSVPKDTFISMDKVVTPIQDPNKISLPQVKCLLTHYDICARCGTRYCTRAEIKFLPVTTQHRSGSAIRGMGPAR